MEPAQLAPAEITATEDLLLSPSQVALGLHPSLEQRWTGQLRGTSQMGKDGDP